MFSKNKNIHSLNTQDKYLKNVCKYNLIDFPHWRQQVYSILLFTIEPKLGILLWHVATLQLYKSLKVAVKPNDPTL